MSLAIQPTKLRSSRPSSLPSTSPAPNFPSAARTRALQAVRDQMAQHKRTSGLKTPTRGKENTTPAPKTTRPPVTRVATRRVSTPRPKSPTCHEKVVRRVSAPLPTRNLLRSSAVTAPVAAVKPMVKVSMPIRTPVEASGQPPRHSMRDPPPITRPVPRTKGIRPNAILGLTAPNRQLAALPPTRHVPTPVRQTKPAVPSETVADDLPQPAVQRPASVVAVLYKPPSKLSDGGDSKSIRKPSLSQVHNTITSLFSPIPSLPSDDLTLFQRAQQLQKQASLPSCAPTAILSPTTTPTANDFTMLKHLGHGSFGTVFLTKPHCMDKLLAVKVLSKVSAQAEGSEHQIYEEAKILRKVTGVNFLLGIEASFHDAAHYYLVMDYCPTNLLATYRKNRNVPVDHLRFWASELVLGINALHKLNIVHRDLKLDNILLRPDGHIVIADFGLSKTLEGPAPIAPNPAHLKPLGKVIPPMKRTKVGGRVVPTAVARGRVGTRNYMAPEIWTRNPYSYSVDWFAFGVMLYMLQYHKFPWGGDDEQVEEGILRRHPVFPDGAKYDNDCAALIRTLLVKNPDNRATVSEIKASTFFSKLDWKKVAAQGYTVPFLPSDPYTITTTPSSSLLSVGEPIPANADPLPEFTWMSVSFAAAFQGPALDLDSTLSDDDIVQKSIVSLDGDHEKPVFDAPVGWADACASRSTSTTSTDSRSSNVSPNTTAFKFSDATFTPPTSPTAASSVPAKKGSTVTGLKKLWKRMVGRKL